jgi:hypothetical protein
MMLVRGIGWFFLGSFLVFSFISSGLVLLRGLGLVTLRVLLARRRVLRR